MNYAYLDDLGLTVFENGDIYSRRGKKLTPTKDKVGYMFLSFTKPCGKRGRTGVHRIVAMAFIPNPDRKPDVNHKDGNKQNNAVENLEWLTRYENIMHAVENNLFPSRNKKKLRNEEIKKRVFSGEDMEKVAKDFNLSPTRVWQIVQGHNGTRKTERKRKLAA